MPLLLVQGFLNTRDPDTRIDLLGEPRAAGQWFGDAGLLDSRPSISSAEVGLAGRLRESLRALLVSGAGEATDATAIGPLQELAQARRPRLAIDQSGLISLENPQHDTLTDGLFELLLIVRAAQEDGSWTRLKACANPDCGWVFYDRSRNQHGNWCDMAVCGNRLKNRRLRARRR